MYGFALIITTILLIGYCCLLLMYRQWLIQLPVFTHKNNTRIPATHFSVIVPARNEETNIKQCLESILQQAYSRELFEVIIVNDHSTDETENIVLSLQKKYSNLFLLNLKDHLDKKQLTAYKKKAIEMAVLQSKGNWIVTTDADCIVTANWLSNFDQYIQERNPVFVAAPVMFTNNHSFLSVFQLLDFLSLQGITAAAVSAGYHSMCNGANICYRKDVFNEVGMFAGIDHIASGDDMLLMHKIKIQYPDQIGYLYSRDSIVLTAPMGSWKEFFNQRVRWASKASSYQDKSIYWILLLVYLLNASLFVLLVSSPFIYHGLINWLILVGVKTLVELSFMFPVARFYGQAKALFWFPLMQPFHIVYTVVAGWLGKFGTYQWKGRKVK